jgi:hypothetical protein
MAPYQVRLEGCPTPVWLPKLECRRRTSPPRPLSATATHTVAPRFREGRLVHIQSDVCDIVHSSRPSCMRLCAGHPAQPSTLCMPSGGPPITQRTSGLVLWLIRIVQQWTEFNRSGAGLIVATLSVVWVHCIIEIANDVVEVLRGSGMCDWNCGHQYEGSSAAKQPSTH